MAADPGELCYTPFLILLGAGAAMRAIVMALPPAGVEMLCEDTPPAARVGQHNHDVTLANATVTASSVAAHRAS